MLGAIASMVFDPFTRFTPQDFVFKIARSQEEIEGFWSFRRTIFCEEQNALGCREFLATVQHQNAKFFQRLHWETLGELELFGLRHVKMRADLGYYQPAKCIF